jgi:hypothetical protein
MRRGDAACCARAASGHAAAVTPRSVMNSHRSYSVKWSRAKRRVIGNAGLEKIQLARLV